MNKIVISLLWLLNGGLYKDDITRNTSESTKAFNYQAQTPTTFFLIEKINNNKNNIKNLKILDKIERDYIDYILKRYSICSINNIKFIF